MSRNTETNSEANSEIKSGETSETTVEAKTKKDDKIPEDDLNLAFGAIANCPGRLVNVPIHVLAKSLDEAREFAKRVLIKDVPDIDLTKTSFNVQEL